MRSYVTFERFYVLAKKRSMQQKSGTAAKFAVAGLLSCVLAGCIGFGFASAAGGSASSLKSFGITADDDSSTESTSDTMEVSTQESSVLTTTSSRDISEGIATIEAEEEAARLAAEEAARIEEEERIAAAEAAKAEQEAQAAAEGAASDLASLSDVDWTIGEEAFVAEWTERIDAYLAGSTLAGYGSVFAQAAWEYGVDPRWSPAISNTESTKGANCFKPYNAWGWMTSTTWSSWEEGIYAHVSGLANGYGYSITVANAQKYCPPTYMDWFDKTLTQMKLI